MSHAAEAHAADPVLVIKDVAKSFGLIAVLDEINMTLAAGERRAVIGPNGAGKSTLFNLVSGRFAVSRGSISLNGRRIDGKPPHRLNRMGLSRSFQITQVFKGLSLYENVYLAVMSRHRRRWSIGRFGPVWARVREEADRLLEQAQLMPQRDRIAGTLAYSEQRALEICMTVATGPSIILLDEPTAGMSRSETANMVQFIDRMTKDCTLLMVEHDMDVVFGLADTISVLANGRILATGTPQEIRNNSQVQDAYLSGSAH